MVLSSPKTRTEARNALAAGIMAVACAATLTSGSPPPAAADVDAPAAASGTVLFFDDFSGASLDTTKWVAGLHQWGPDNYGVVPENLSLTTVNDAGTPVDVLAARANGDQYTGAVRGILATDASYPVGDPRRYTRQETGVRTGGLVWTKERFGAGRYEVRMKTLPYSGGCSCIWNYYNPGNGDYTEIDIEMPAAGTGGRADWAHWAGFNSYVSLDPGGATLEDVDLGAAQNDGAFHTYRWDWYDGSNGTPRIEFYVDNVLYATQTATVPTLPAQLWVGNWAASWSGDFDYASQYQYIDWVKISTLGGQ